MFNKHIKIYIIIIFMCNTIYNFEKHYKYLNAYYFSKLLLDAVYKSKLYLFVQRRADYRIQ